MKFGVKHIYSIYIYEAPTRYQALHQMLAEKSQTQSLLSKSSDLVEEPEKLSQKEISQ